MTKPYYLQEHYLKELDIRLRESWFSEQTPGAYETAIGIIYSINNRKELDPYLIKYKKNTRKLLNQNTSMFGICWRKHHDFLNVWNQFLLKRGMKSMCLRKFIRKVMNRQ